MASQGPLRLLCLLLACAGASAANFKYFLKRSQDNVDSICYGIPSTKRTFSWDNADSMYIGNSKNIKGRGNLCASPVVVYSVGSTMTFGSCLPPVISNTTINASVWSAEPNDTVSFTAENAVPKRSLTVLGASVVIELSGPSPNNPFPTQAVIESVPASAFNSSFESELILLEQYLDWYFNNTKNTNGLQSAIIIQRDAADADGSTLDVLYAMFEVDKDGSVTGYMFSSSYDLLTPVLLPPACSRSSRRLLSIRGGQRHLLQYDGGSDSVPSSTCSLVCRYVLGKRVCICK